MNRFLFLLPILLIGLMVVMPVGHALQSPIFFDDFTGSGFPAGWSGLTSNDLGNVTQNGGYLDVASQRLISSSTKLIANQSAPIIGPNTPDGQVVYMVWKMYPINVTNPPGIAPQVATRFVDLTFGLRQNNWVATGSSSEITFNLRYTENPSYSNLTQKVSVSVSIIRPMTGAANCYDSNPQWQSPGFAGLIDQSGLCTGTRGMITYTGFYAGIDPTALHIFTIYSKFYPVSHTSWIAFNMDNFGYMNITQQACACIDQVSAGGSYVAMYPAIRDIWSATCNTCSASQQSVYMNQALGTFIDYVLVTDYIPSAFPLGQILPSPITPPASVGMTNPCQLITLTGCFQFNANSIGAGNLYLGGFFLLTLMMVMTFGVLSLGHLKIGFLSSFISLVIVMITSLVGIIPLWMSVGAFLLAAGGAAGLYGTRITIWRRGEPE